METSVRGKDGKKPRTVYLKVSFWRAGPSGTGIFMTAKEWPKPILVRKNPEKKSGHPYLWDTLNTCLNDAGFAKED
jgi:hypothetical protein